VAVLPLLTPYCLLLEEAEAADCITAVPLEVQAVAAAAENRVLLPAVAVLEFLGKVILAVVALTIITLVGVVEKVLRVELPLAVMEAVAVLGLLGKDKEHLLAAVVAVATPDKALVVMAVAAQAVR